MNSSGETNPFSNLRLRMVESQLRGRGIGDQRVLAAMLRVPRDEFAPERYRDQAYEDHPVPIGEGQTISQPYIVARMLESLELTPVDRVLEVGTGSGYLTALLAELAGQVFSVERHAVLADTARELLGLMGYTNVKVIVGDGSQGFAEEAPYDAIIVSAATAEVPPALLEQLAEGGRMILPVGPADSQQLQLIRIENGQTRTALRELCRFVPLVSDPRPKTSDVRPQTQDGNLRR
jgi:protein-L-isoaspartate(D-aspartate) O-methyltransferase